jgi:nucleoside-diphosphate-sugar epimerase
MASLRVLFIGGTGIISSACATRAIASGIELTILNRGATSIRPVPEGAEVITADVRDAASVRTALGDRSFDVVADFIAFTPDHVRADVELFTGRTGQYVFISSASVYQKPLARLPITESTPLSNPWWSYSRDKIACELRLNEAYRDWGFPATIVRPSHTYDRTRLPNFGRYTVVDRMRKGQKIVIHGDGSSLWVLTHHRDFARGFIGLLGNDQAIGDSFHITSDEVLTWNQIYASIARAAGVSELDIVYVPSNMIARYDQRWGESLLGDKQHSVIFDNTRIKSVVPDYVATIPYSTGVREVMTWFDEDPTRRVVEEPVNELIDRIAADWTPTVP